MYTYINIPIYRDPQGPCNEDPNGASRALAMVTLLGSPGPSSRVWGITTSWMAAQHFQFLMFRLGSRPAHPIGVCWLWSRFVCLWCAFQRPDWKAKLWNIVLLE